ncbi:MULTISPECIES: sulfurtransferase TusA family protein [Nitrincola]|uniref:Sulfurtransferase TusA family protein n=2 Tax=Nitrincola TaxID=267849 RepID=A0A364NN54_9GAMM|nr:MULTISPECIES: sulfurtransferase TusA family protein [Nitrincola]EXJ11484.1 Sulfurtransferase TusA [Nitrincola nitratireducens]RAU18464.1 sulfurtransferase TusA family protein [Nitrincola tibetensis]
MHQHTIDQRLDTSGLHCPLPLLKAKQALNKMLAGQVLEVIATDSGSVRDFDVYVQQSDHSMLETFTQEGTYVYIIRRG